MNETVEETGDGFEIVQASEVNRRERRKGLRFYKKELSNHMNTKPAMDVDIESETTAKQEKRVAMMRGWGTRYMTLIAKINEYESK